jgi:hypothetical protein
MRVAISLGILLLWTTWSGCGTTKWTDTARTATEQLLITDSMDRAVSRLDLRALAGKKIFVDDTPAKQVTDSTYLVSAIRQHVLASGAILKDKRDDAEYILEIRAGAVGTDHHDLLLGIPATNLPTIGVMAGAPTQIPEIAIAKKTDQRGVAKISLFAYNRETGRPVWQSGAVPEESTTKALWLLGAGPFRRGTIHEGTTFAGAKLHIPLIDPMLADDEKHRPVSVADEAFFVEPKEPLSKAAKPAVAGQPGTPGKDQAAAAPAAAPPAGAGPPNSPGPQDAAPLTSRRPDSSTGPAGINRPQGPEAFPDRQVERIGDVPASPPYVEPGPPPAGDFRPSGPAPRWDVSPTGAVMPLSPSATPTQPPGEAFLGDTWLGRRR